MSNLIYWIWLTTRRGVGVMQMLSLLDIFVTPQRIYYAEAEDFDGIEGITPNAIQGLMDKNLRESNEILAKCDQLGIRLMTIQDGDYPERLRQIDDPPPLLYVKGKPIHFDDHVVIGMVGTRQPTSYGVTNAGKLALEITRGGGIVVSGIALGIDAAALRGGLKGGGVVVSVLAGGIDQVSPKENRFLAQDVAVTGMIISEYPPGTISYGPNYLMRNRIISGLSLGVIAVECQVQSGTMTTIRRATDQNRDIFALAGNVDAPMSRGPNWLIRQGAQLITCGEDVLEEYRSRYPSRIPEVPPLEAEVLEARMEDLTRETPAERVKKPQPPPEPKPSSPSREFVPISVQRDRYTDDELAILRTLH